MPAVGGGANNAPYGNGLTQAIHVNLEDGTWAPLATDMHPPELDSHHLAMLGDGDTIWQWCQNVRIPVVCSNRGPEANHCIGIRVRLLSLKNLGFHVFS